MSDEHDAEQNADANKAPNLPDGKKPAKKKVHDVRPSYVEGLQAINSEDLPGELRDALQLDHSREYMERKFREWQQQNEANSDNDLLLHIAANGLPTPDGTNNNPSTPTTKRIDREQFPYLDIEFTQLSKCSQQSSKAWRNAYSAFPKLKTTLEYRDAMQLMKALVLNELQQYQAKTLGRDEEARGKTVSAQHLEPLGFTQMTPKTVHELESGLIAGKKVRTELTQLTSFLTQCGHTGDGHEARALLDPNCVPILVAAKLESLIEYYERARDKFSAKPMRVDAETLAYGYKPDVFYNPKDPGNPNFHAVTSSRATLDERMKGNVLLFPCSMKNVLKESVHLANIDAWFVRLNDPS